MDSSSIQDSDSSSEEDWNGQTPIEFWASFVLCFLTIAILVWAGKGVQVHRWRRWMRRYRQSGLSIMGSMVDYQLRYDSERPGLVVGCDVTIEYEEPTSSLTATPSTVATVSLDNSDAGNDDQEETKQNEVLIDHHYTHSNSKEQVPMIPSSTLRRQTIQKIVRSGFGGLFLYRHRRSLLRNDENEVDNDSEEEYNRVLLEVLVLPGYPLSGFPRVLVDHELASEQEEELDTHPCVNSTLLVVLFIILLIIDILLLITSIRLQFQKPHWDMDYDIAPLVWMILLGALLLFALALFAIVEGQRMTFLKNYATVVEVTRSDCEDTSVENADGVFT